ncbi:MAG: NUDIX hydrolase [Candidatus Parcubacteria bacterium]|nr:NUDIX hydrolase [Candidatus Parcubacteria bacterium]
MNNSNDKEGDKVFMVLRDKDVFPNVPEATEVVDIVWKVRPTGKVVLFNEENKIALMGNKVNTFLLLPGGGIDDNESILDGITRECQEETGCKIELQKTLGVTEDFRLRDSRHCISFGFSAKVISYGTPSLTENEADIGAYVKWLSLPEAIELLTLQEEKVKNGEVKFYNTCFNTIRDSFFAKKAKDLY